jgi:SAM-dependent MidA family methyltransferase
LYNPHYGYFPKEAVIYSPDEPFDFTSMRNGAEFMEQFTDHQAAFEDALDEKELVAMDGEDDDTSQTRIDVDKGSKNDLRQLWHTPTELFQPYYAEAMARYMATNYKLSQYPYYDLLIYEMGAGNGTFMLGVLDYIRDEYPEVYERTKFKIIEISSSLADLQMANLCKRAAEKGHLEKVEIINKSIFDWDTYVASPCFFVALEVWDNFAHDCIRYDTQTGDAFQTWVLIDRNGEYYEYYETKIDPVASRFLRIRDEATDGHFDHPLKRRDWSRKLVSMLPGSSASARLSIPEYIPTRLMQFFDILHNYFPAHKLLSSDFSNFKSEVPGLNAPAVQTRFKRQMVGVTTPLVLQGHFDIMFPTDFQTMEAMYRAMTGKLTRVVSQEDFLKRWAYTDETQTKNGENPLLDWYKNASMMLTL